jgi:hypothetical protein
MNRFFALVGALLLASISIASACTAAPGAWVHFTLDTRHGTDRIQASFRNDDRPNHGNNWSTDFRPTDLVGLDLAGFRGAGSRPLRFAVIREAGRLDCSGHGGESYAAGNCSFTRDPAFTRLIQSRGIGNPTDEQAFGLMAVNARRDVIDAVANAHYPKPSINDLMALSALGVDGAYIRNIAAAGYRPESIDALIQFKALNITPAWIAGFARMGYASLPASELVQLKALDITPEFIAGFDRIGYSHLPVDQLVQLKALGITPDFVQRVAAADAGHPSVNKLVELKALGKKR